MKILLINDNPVVSRLLVLCTRGETVVLDEVINVNAVKDDGYDIVFVDEASYESNVAELFSVLDNCKKVFISYDNQPMDGFDVTIKKPFLPSQILELIENSEPEDEVQKDEMLEEEVETVEEDHFIFPLATEEKSEEEIQKEEIEVEKEEMPSIFPLSDDVLDEEVLEVVEEDENPAVLDSNEIDKIKALLDMDEEELALPTEDLSDDEYEIRKMEAIKEQLIADGLEIVAEEEIVEALSATNEKKSVKKKKKNKSKKKNQEYKKSTESKKDKTNKKSKKSKIKKKKEITFTEEELESIEDAIEVAVGTVTKKQMKQLLKGKKIEVSIEIEGDK